MFQFFSAVTEVWTNAQRTVKAVAMSSFLRSARVERQEEKEIDWILLGPAVFRHCIDTYVLPCISAVFCEYNNRMKGSYSFITRDCSITLQALPSALPTFQRMR